MSTTHTERTERSVQPGAGQAPAAAPLHPRSFKLRFAAQREPGRSHVSAVKPLALPATVTDKFHRREPEPPLDEPLRRVRDMFRRGPRDKYGWWAHAAQGASAACATGAVLSHHIRDSAWLKARVRVLAADCGYRR